MDLTLLLLVISAVFLGVLAGLAWQHWRHSAALANLVLHHEAELADALASTEVIGQRAVEQFRATLWHEQSCQGPHDFPREPDFRKGKWLQYHCIRCGHVLWREKTQAGLGMKAGG